MSLYLSHYLSIYLVMSYWAGETIKMNAGNVHPSLSILLNLLLMHWSSLFEHWFCLGYIYYLVTIGFFVVTGPSLGP